MASCLRTDLGADGLVPAEAFGEHVPSTCPWPEQHEAGRGVLLQCHCYIKPLIQNIKDTIYKMEAGSVMTIAF